MDVHSEWIHALRKFTVLWSAAPAIFNIRAVFPAFLCTLGATGQTPNRPVSKDLQAILWVCGLVKNEEGSLDDRPHEASSIHRGSKHGVAGQLGSSLK